MNKIVSWGKAQFTRRKLRAEGKTVVFTNGHFDLLHVGHVDYLQKAKALGDVLIVGLNSDASTRVLKGEKRPIIPQDERARILAALACVDYVVIFEETTANNLVEVLEPDIYVKGGDWYAPPEAESVAGYGGQIHFLPYLPGHSTTHLIETIIWCFTSREMKMGPVDIHWSVDGGRFHFIIFVNDKMIVERQPGLLWLNTCNRRVNRIIAWLGGWRGKLTIVTCPTSKKEQI